jgi:putative ABC transport system permease protein
MVGVALGVAVILATAIANQSTVAAFKTMIDSITGKADFMISGSSGGGFDDSALERVRRIPGVAIANPGILRSAGWSVEPGQEPEPIEVAGIDPLVDRRLRQYRSAGGRFLKPDERGLLATERFALDNNLEIGDDLVLTAGGARRRFELVGLLKDEGAGRFMAGRVLFLPLDQARELFGLEGRLTYIDAKVESGESIELIGERISADLGPGFIVEQPDQRVEAVSEMLASLRVGLSFFGAIAMFVGAFLVYNTFAMAVLEQTHELGILRSLGAGRRQLVLLVLTQAAIVGLAGSVLGILIGIGLAKLLLSFMVRTVEIPVGALVVPPLGLGLAVVIGTAVTVVSALQPAMIAGRVSPLAAIKIFAAKATRRLSVIRVLVGVAVIAMGLGLSSAPVAETLTRYGDWMIALSAGGAFFYFLGAGLLTASLIGPLGRVFSWPAKFLFGRTGGLAAANLIRNPGRTAATAAAVMTTLAMLISVGGMVSSFRVSVDRWVDRSLGADVFVSGKSIDTIFDQRFGDRLRRIEGVDDLTASRWTTVRVGETRVAWRGIEPRSHRRFATLQFTEGRQDEAWRQLSRGGYVFVSAPAAHKRGLRVGDQITVVTNLGEKKFKVAAVMVEFAAESGDLLIGSARDTEKYLGIDEISGFRLKVGPGAKPQEVAERIRKKYGGLDLEVRDIQELKDMAGRQVNDSFAVFNVLVLLAGIVALISIFNTLMMNILERRREIGLLRAVGATQGQVALMTLVEAFVIGCIGGGLGLLLGSYASSDIVGAMKSLTGYEISYVFPWITGAIGLALAVAGSVAAAVYPARRASLEPLGEALKCE